MSEGNKTPLAHISSLTYTLTPPCTFSTWVITPLLMSYGIIWIPMTWPGTSCGV